MLLPDLGAGGAERVALTLAREFVRRGVVVELVLCRAVGELLSEVPSEMRVIDLDAPRFRNLLMPLVAYLRAERPGAMLASMWPLSGIAAMAKALSRSGCRLVVAEHTNLSRSGTVRGLADVVHRRFGRLLYAPADAIVTVSQGVRRDLLERTGVSPGAVSVIHNPVSPPRGAGAPDPAILDAWRRGDPAVIAVGALKEAKDHANLLHAFARLRGGRPGARLLILGEGPLRGDLKELAGAMGLGESLAMPGYVPDPYLYLERADLFVLSSSWEGLPTALIEALIAGVPVVSTDCPSGPSEILENGRYGRLVPVDDPQALAAAMAEALDASHDRDALRRRGAEFSVEQAADRYLALLDPREAAHR